MFRVSIRGFPTSKSPASSKTSFTSVNIYFCSSASLKISQKAGNTFHKMKDVGHLMVKVLKAQGLHSADIGGKSDPFAVIELCNDRMQTNTEYKTLAPSWQKMFQL